MSKPTVEGNTTKKSAQKPRLIVRQTLTSKLRAERADKLQFIKNQNDILSKTLQLERTISEQTPRQTAIKNNVSKVKSQVRSTLVNKKDNIVETKPKSEIKDVKINLQNNNLIKKKLEVKFVSNLKRNVLNKKEVEKPVICNSIIKKPMYVKSKVNQEKKTVKVNSPLRKSLSAMHFKRVKNSDKNSIIQRTKSCSGIPPTLIPESFEFKTPSKAQRRSIVFRTPVSNRSSIISPITIVDSSSTSDLKNRLSLWLKKKGKPLDSFHHLRYFSMNSFPVPIDEENKENEEVFILDSSYENLNIPVKSRNVSVAVDALYDLHKLIQDNYDRDQCELWLQLINSNYPEVVERHQYWECRAALEEARGNYQGALNSYTNAIAKGAEMHNVNEPLDNLLEKFSILNIGPEKINNQQQKLKSNLDARNIFKSSIISFAIKERAAKNKDKEDAVFRFVATPVRRSTRKSRSAYVSTPKVQVCPTLDKIESPVRKSLHFKTNKFL